MVGLGKACQGQAGQASLGWARRGSARCVLAGQGSAGSAWPGEVGLGVARQACQVLAGCDMVRQARLGAGGRGMSWHDMSRQARKYPSI